MSYLDALAHLSHLSWLTAPRDRPILVLLALVLLAVGLGFASRRRV